jgi:hypothetical protein
MSQSSNAKPGAEQPQAGKASEGLTAFVPGSSTGGANGITIANLPVSDQAAKMASFRATKEEHTVGKTDDGAKIVEDKLGEEIAGVEGGYVRIEK